MKKSIFFSALFALVFVVCAGFKPHPTTTVQRTVSFGDPTQDICVGRGVCKNTTGATNDNTDGITVTFSVMASDPNILVMKFSLADLKNYQSGQVAYFTDASASYNFQNAYEIPADMILDLDLQQGARILPNSPSVIEINGDVVTNYITYSHN